MARHPTKYIVVDSSLYKTLKDHDSVAIVPTIEIGAGINMDGYQTFSSDSSSSGFGSRSSGGYLGNILGPGSSYDQGDFSLHWNITYTGSNFKNALEYHSVAEVSPLTDWNEKNIKFKVSGLQEGEVFFFRVCLTIRSGSYTYKGFGNQIACRGNPINTKFRIYKIKNGRTIQEDIYDNAIQSSISTALRGAALDLDWKNTDNGRKVYLKNYMKNFHRKKDQPGKRPQGVIRHKTPEGFRNFTRTTYGFRHITDEKDFYACGNTIDMLSIQSLFDQNPRNNLKKGLSYEPNPKDISDAMRNIQYDQPQGYTAFDFPLLNPGTLKERVMYYPGRSAHGASGEQTSTCDASSADDTNNNNDMYDDEPEENPNDVAQSDCYDEDSNCA